MKRRRGGGWWALGVVAFLLGGYEVYRMETPLPTVTETLAANDISADIVTSNDNGPAATITLSRLGDTSGTVTIVIPAGTVLYAGDAGSQRLITAKALTFVLASGISSMKQQVDTYCIDEFSTTPGLATSLSFAPTTDGGGVGKEETEPLHKLADCMDGLSVSDQDKQVAVWAVSEQLLSHSKSDALQILTDKLSQSMAQQRHDSLEQKKPGLAAAFPLLSSDQIDGLIETEYRQGMADLQSLAAKTAANQLNGLINDDKDMLGSCGYNTASLAIFQ